MVYYNSRKREEKKTADKRYLEENIRKFARI